MSGMLFFPRVIFYTFMSSLLIYVGLGVGVFGLVSLIGCFKVVFSVHWVWCLWCRAFSVFRGGGSLYKHIRINLGKNLASGQRAPFCYFK